MLQQWQTHLISLRLSKVETTTLPVTNCSRLLTSHLTSIAPTKKHSVFRQQIHNSVLIVAATSDPPFINISQLATTAVVTWWSGFDRVPPRRPRWFLTIMCMLAHLCSAHLLMPARLSTLVFFCGHRHTHTAWAVKNDEINHTTADFEYYFRRQWTSAKRIAKASSDDTSAKQIKVTARDTTAKDKTSDKTPNRPICEPTGQYHGKTWGPMFRCVRLK